jgi:hypothetical protein
MNRQFGRGDFYFRFGLGDKSDIFRVNMPEKIALDELPPVFFHESMGAKLFEKPISIRRSDHATI